MRSGRSVTAAEPQHTHSIPDSHPLVPELTRGTPASQTGRLARALTEPFIPIGEPEERPSRLRINGVAELSTDDPLLAEFPGGQLLVRFRPTAIFPNCPRYIPKMRIEEPSRYNPRVGYDPPQAEWKTHDDMRDVVPPRRT